jgi:hypothetical protein
MAALLKKEWEKVLRKFRHKGAEAAADKLCGLMNQGGPVPLALAVQFVEYLLKRGETSTAGIILKTAEAKGVAHPLLAKLHSSWLWCEGDRERAIKYAQRAARQWSRPYLYSQLAALHHLAGNAPTADHFYRAAALLAADEEREETSSSRQKQKKPSRGIKK